MKTGGGEPAVDVDPCMEEWLVSVLDLVDENVRFTGLGEDLEAGIGSEDTVAYKELTRCSRGIMQHLLLLQTE